MKGNALQLPTGELIAIDDTIQLEIYSPFFDREEVRLANGNRVNPQGNVSTGISRFSRGELQALLGHIDKFTVRDQPREIANVKLLSDGVVVDRGKLIIEQYDGNMNNGTGTFQLTFIAGDRDTFMEAIRDKNLRDLQMSGEIEIEGGDISAWGPILQDPPDEYFLGPGSSGGGIFVNPAGAPPVANNPVVYLDIFDDLSPYAHAATAIWAKDVVENGHDYVCFPTIVRKSDDESPDVIINRWDASGQFITYSSQERYLDGGATGTYTVYEKQENPIVPMYYYHQVLRHIFTEHGYTLKDDWLLQDVQFLKLALINTHSILRPLTVYMDKIHGKNFDGNTLYYEQTTYIKPKNHLPDVTIIEFLKDFMLKFNVYFEVNGTEVSIIHSELDKIDREIKTLSPNYQIKIEPSTGITLTYDLTENDAYATEETVVKPYKTLPDSASEAALSNGDLYIDKELNFIYTKATGDDAVLCSNLIPYTSGAGKKYTMPFVGVNQVKYMLTRILDEAPDTENPLSLLPFIYGTITSEGSTHYDYLFADEIEVTGAAPNTYDIFQHKYNFNFEEIEAADAPQSFKILGFYHGLMKTIDITTAALEYPYMSNHNYKPGHGSPKIGDWHLGIIGEEGLVETFHAASMAMYDKGRKIYIRADESLLEAKNHPWKNAVVIRGNRLYIAAIKNNLPWDNYPIYECWEL